jgi:hypothetical protein
MDLFEADYGQGGGTLRPMYRQMKQGSGVVEVEP